MRGMLWIITETKALKRYDPRSVRKVIVITRVCTTGMERYKIGSKII